MFKKLNTLHLKLFLNLGPYSMQDEKQKKSLITLRLYLEEVCFYFFLVCL